MSLFARTFSVLIVENDPDALEMIKKTINKAFPEAKPTYFFSITDLQAFLASEQGQQPENRPKLILLNLPTPAEGWQTLTMVRRHADWRLSPVLMLVPAQEDIGLLYQQAPQGVSSFIGKPASAAAWNDCLAAIRNYWYKAVRVV